MPFGEGRQPYHLGWETLVHRVASGDIHIGNVGSNGEGGQPQLAHEAVRISFLAGWIYCFLLLRF